MARNIFSIQRLRPAFFGNEDAGMGSNSQRMGLHRGAILLAAGIGVAINKKSRIAAASIGALMTALTLSSMCLFWLSPAADRRGFQRRDQLRRGHATLCRIGARTGIGIAERLIAQHSVVPYT